MHPFLLLFLLLLHYHLMYLLLFNLLLLQHLLPFCLLLLIDDVSSCGGDVRSWSNDVSRTKGVERRLVAQCSGGRQGTGKRIQHRVIRITR